MFYTFFIAARVGGGWMDKFGPKKPVVFGFLLGAIGMVVWGGELSELSHGATLAGMLLTGAGFGLIFSPLNTDALNRLPDSMRGQGSGVVQTFRNFGSAIGMAIMGSIVAGATDLTGPERPRQLRRRDGEGLVRRRRDARRRLDHREQIHGRGQTGGDRGLIPSGAALSRRRRFPSCLRR